VSLPATVSALRDTVLRMFPHRAVPGLIPVGTPGPDSPVLLTCSFTLTLRRLQRVLAGRNVWLLAADTHGINVWCAAGGGYLTHHEVIAAIRSTGIEELVDHRELILPQLAATGVEPRRVRQATGWESRWGPARLEDLPAYLDRGRRTTRRDRRMRFPLWERLEMASMWAVWTALGGGALFALLGGWRTGVGVVISVLLTVGAVFAALPRLVVTGHRRWLTYGAFAILGTGIGAAVMLLLGAPTPRNLALQAVASVLAMAVLSIDLAGTTPWYPSTINTFRNFAHIDLEPERCTFAGDCVQVCPAEVLRLDGPTRKVVIARPDACLQCGACIVQCPSDALRFRYPDGRIIPPAAIRSTRMNMLGRRTVTVEGHDPAVTPGSSDTPA